MSTPQPAPSPARILVVDDEPDLRTLYELTLLREGHQVHTAGSLAEARGQLGRQRFDVVITDMRLTDGQGIELLRELSARRASERSVVITAYGSAENAVEALKCGAFDYLTKPVDLQQFRSVINAAVLAEGAATSPARVAAPDQAAAPAADAGPAVDTDSGHAALARLVGESAAMRAIKQAIVRVAPSMAPVLVRGESGTGKELVAQAIHACSHRAAGPFVPVNCGAIPENLLEAEFFGARKGAYTGAQQDRNGFFQAARGGTLFLDEIGDLPLAMQAKLLRAIQERRVRPLGDTREEAMDVRIVSATHKDLAAEVQAGHFRQDLYYRLNVIEIVVPPLRARREDLPALCSALLRRIADEAGLDAPALPDGLLPELATAPLPGNVRELENLLHRALALRGEPDGEAASVAAVAQPQAAAMPRPSAQPAPADAANAAAPESDSALPALPVDLQAWLDQQERRVLEHALRATGFNRTAAAALLDLNLRQIRYRIARLGITAPSDKAPGDEPG
ncbi:sigma-54 dependent transcriptional regulator [Ottowia sp.]|uniref:sigma-54-dependent transcriptional regulator n=1 Tax=Ottowia sp. TaxID=1898956 RepID=UPI002C257E37|nr:sigma-54 dependent transcriptional regulator [Ottowia sp.]HRN76199.1 sigma-54 dependent transcriptional regulator [Ottowia sp.]HRQ03250.1 sigma-54 dependent transcriptional regulator [Ottowia sp.]